MKKDFENVAVECRDAVRGAFHQLKGLAERQGESFAPVTSWLTWKEISFFFKNVSPMVSTFLNKIIIVLLPKCNRLLLMLSEYRRIQSAFSLCEVPSSAEDIYQLNGLLRNAFTMMAMLDYPYSTHFMGNMPANPVKVNCTVWRCSGTVTSRRTVFPYEFATLTERKMDGIVANVFYQ